MAVTRSGFRPSTSFVTCYDRTGTVVTATRTGPADRRSSVDERPLRVLGAAGEPTIVGASASTTAVAAGVKAVQGDASTGDC